MGLINRLDSTAFRNLEAEQRYSKKRRKTFKKGAKKIQMNK